MKNSFLFTVFSLIFLLCSLTRISGYEYLINVLQLVLLVLPLIMIPLNKFKFNTKNNLLILIYLFLVLSSVATIVNGDVGLMRTSLVLAVTFVVATCFLPLYSNDMLKIITWSVIVTQIPLLIIPMLMSGVNSTQYAGVFYNPNTLGNTAVTIFAVVLSLFLMIIQKYVEGISQKKLISKSIISIFLLVLLAYLVILSNSRTSFLSLLAITVLGIVLVAYYVIKNKKIISFLIKGSLLTIVFSGLLAIIFKFTNLYYYFQVNIINKTILKLQNGDVLDVRGDIWITTIKDSKLFGTGEGSDYFYNNFELGAHNTVIKFIGTIGYLPTFFLILIFISLFILSLKYIKKGNSFYKYVPCVLGINFFVLSLAEDMTFKLAMFIFIFAVGAVIGLNKTERTESINV